MTTAKLGVPKFGALRLLLKIGQEGIELGCWMPGRLDGISLLV